MDIPPERFHQLLINNEEYYKDEILLNEINICNQIIYYSCSNNSSNNPNNNSSSSNRCNFSKTIDELNNTSILEDDKTLVRKLIRDIDNHQEHFLPHNSSGFIVKINYNTNLYIKNKIQHNHSGIFNIPFLRSSLIKENLFNNNNNGIYSYIRKLFNTNLSFSYRANNN